MFLIFSIYLSPSNVSGSLSLLSNPSSLGIKKCIEISYLHNEKELLLSFLNWGIGLNYSEGINIYTSSVLLSNDYFGLGLGKTKDFSTILGMYLRPKNFLTFGMNLKLNNDSLCSDVGLSIKPFTENSIITFLSASLFPYNTIFKGAQNSVIYEISGEYPELLEWSILGKDKCFAELLFELNKINESKEIKKIIFIIKKNGLGLAQSEEIRNLISEISKNKITYGYSEYLTIKNLYLLTACDSVIIPPNAELDLSGILVEKTYIKGLLEKLGIEPQFIKIGRYKSAVEFFASDSMSEFDKIQIEGFINTIVDILIRSISESKNINIENLVDIMDTLGFLTSKEALELNIVDNVMFIEELKEKTGIKNKYDKEIKRSSLSTVFLPKIALLVIEGNIKHGESSPEIPFLNEKSVGDETLIRVIEDIKKDRRIKGVIVRINSPGGDAFASSRIRNALISLIEKKPVLISFGNISASGGYLISSIGCKIFASGLTQTGSIGIFLGKLSFANFYKKIGINKDHVKFGKHADVFSDSRKFDNFEIKRIKKILEEHYNEFTKAVANSRNISQDSVNTIGEGRIWSGKDAISIGLVDKQGGLLDAISEMKKILKIKGKAKLVFYPEKKDIFNLIFRTKNNYLEYFNFEEENIYFWEPIRIFIK